jgi:phosphate starvation-inducible protein PhoH
LVNIVKKLEDVNGIGVIHFKASSIVRHPLIASIIEKFEEE